jgi:two-component system OmpR family sensor kinase
LSLRLRLALFGAGVVALTLLIFGTLLYLLLARGVSTNQDDALRSRGQAAARSLQDTFVQPQPPIAPADLATSTDVYVEVLDVVGRPVYSTARLHGQPPPVPAGLLDQAVAHHGAFATEGETSKGTQLRVYATSFAGGYVLAGQSTRVPASSLSGIVVFLIVSAVPALLAALLASWLVAGRALRPLRVVASAADEIGRTRDFGRRLQPGRSRDEVSLLSASFNHMLEALQAAYRDVAAALEAQRRFVADASHELRTPLATIQGNAGLLAQGPEVTDEVRRAAAADIAGESERMARLTDRLLTLARADAGLKLQLAPVELRPLVAEVVRQEAALHPDTSFAVEASEVSVAGDPDALRQLLWNLLDNAARHARSAVSVALHADGTWARLMVADDGPGVPESERERIFERFYKVDSARTGEHGAGLGLAITRWISEQHGGRVIAGEGPAGGAGFFVDLPLLLPRP